MWTIIIKIAEQSYDRILVGLAKNWREVAELFYGEKFSNLLFAD